MESDPFEERDLRTAVTFGNRELTREWVQLQRKRGNKRAITCKVLFPAALYGQLEILKDNLGDGERGT